MKPSLFRNRSPDKETISLAMQNALRAGSAMRRQDWELAEKLWRNLFKISGNNPPIEAFIGLSECLRQTQKYMEADELLGEVLARHSDSVKLRAEHAMVAFARKNWPEAIRRWQGIIDDFKDKTPDYVYARLIEAQGKIGDLLVVKNISTIASERYPDSQALDVAIMRAFSDAKDWKSAGDRSLSTVKKYGPRLTSNAAAVASKALRYDSKLGEAEKIIASALEIYGQDLHLLIEQAELMAAKEKWSKALELWRFILKNETGGLKLRLADTLNCRFNISVLKRLADIEGYHRQISDYRQRPGSGAKIVLYTAYSKGYDLLKLPEEVNPAFDYVCFTDDPKADGLGVYEIRPFPVVERDGARTIRYPKLHAHVLFPDYDVAIWMDTSIMVGDNKALQETIQRFIKSGKPMGLAMHPERTSLEEEYQFCVDLMKDDPQVMKRQLDSYLAEGVNKVQMAECGVLYYRPKAKNLAATMDLWWRQVLQFSKRDQISFPYAVSKTGLEWYALTQPPNSMREQPEFIFTPHYSELTVLQKLYELLKSRRR